MPKQLGFAYACANREKKQLTIDKKFLKDIKETGTPEAYEYLLHVFNHEIYHFLFDNFKDSNFNVPWDESYTEVASNRTTFGKNKNNLFKYRNDTNGYQDITFGTNILAAAMGVSEKEAIQNAFKNQTTNELNNRMECKYAKNCSRMAGKNRYRLPARY